MDLSGITFLDLQSVRELVVRPPNVVASIKALGMRSGQHLHTSPGSGGPAAFEIL